MERPSAENRQRGSQSLDTLEHLRRCLEQRSVSGPCISLEAEVPEALFEGMRAFLRHRPDWDQYRLITSALAGFLVQNGCGEGCVAQYDLNGLLMAPEH